MIILFTMLFTYLYSFMAEVLKGGVNHGRKPIR